MAQRRRHGNGACACFPVLYGGSVNLENCEALFARSRIDGRFIGRAAWDAHGYVEILRRCSALAEKETSSTG